MTLSRPTGKGISSAILIVVGILISIAGAAEIFWAIASLESAADAHWLDTLPLPWVFVWATGMAYVATGIYLCGE